MSMRSTIVREADKIWKNIAKDSEVGALQLELEIHKKLLNIFQVGDYYYYIFNVKHSIFEFMSDGIRPLLGYDPEKINVPFLLNSIHPDDQPWFLNFENKVAEFFTGLKLEQIPRYKVRYDYRIRKADGDYLRILQQVVTLQNDGTNLLITLGVHTDISHIKQEGVPLLSFIGMDGEPSFINVDVQKVFSPAREIITERERDIVRLLIEGKDSKRIGSELSISKQTVDTHRKNILKKTNCDNTAALIVMAIRKGWV